MSVNKCVFNNSSNISTLADFIEAGNAPALEKFTDVTIDRTKLWQSSDYWLSCVHNNITNWRLAMNSTNSTYAQYVIENIIGQSYYNNMFFETSRFNESGNDYFIDIDGGNTGGFGFLKIQNSTVNAFLLEAVSNDFVIAFFYKGSGNKEVQCFCNDGTTIRKVNMRSTLESYATQRKALANGYATEYSAQPIIMYGRKTPLYSITSNTSNTSLPLYQEVVVADQRFFIVDDDLGIKC